MERPHRAPRPRPSSPSPSTLNLKSVSRRLTAPRCQSAQRSIVTAIEMCNDAPHQIDFVFKLERAEHDAADDRGERFGHRLAVVEHVVRQRPSRRSPPNRVGARARGPGSRGRRTPARQNCSTSRAPTTSTGTARATGRATGWKNGYRSWNDAANDAATISGNSDREQHGVHAARATGPADAESVVANSLVEHATGSRSTGGITYVRTMHDDRPERELVEVAVRRDEHARRCSRVREAVERRRAQERSSHCGCVPSERSCRT